MRFRLIPILFVSLAIIGCSQIYGPAKEVKAYGDAVEPFMQELSTTIAADPKESGVEKGAMLWESRRADLKAKRDAIDAGPRGMNGDWMSLHFHIQDRVRKDLSDIGIRVDYEAKPKFDQLQQDIETTLKLR